MIGRADEHDIEIALLEHVAIVVIEAGTLLRNFWRMAARSAACGELLGIDIAERHDLDRRDLYHPEQIRLAVPAAADQAEAARFIGVEISGMADGSRGSGQGRSPAALARTKSRRFMVAVSWLLGLGQGA